MSTLASKKWILIILAASIILNVLLWILSVAIFPRQSPSAILHYSSGLGIDFVGQGHQIIILPLIGSMILIGNSLLGLGIWRLAPISGWLLLTTSLISQSIILTGFILLWQVNT